MRTWVVPILAGLFLFSASATLGDTIVLDPVDAQAETQDGAVWGLTEGGISIIASRVASTAAEKRGVLEFPLGAIPVGVTIQSATLSYPINYLAYSSSSGYPVFGFSGYAADGLFGQASMLAPFNAVGASLPLDAGGTHTVQISAAYIQSLLGSSSHLGLTVYQQIADTEAGFWAVEGPVPEHAQLEIVYVPEPTTWLLLGGLVVLARRRR